MLDYFNGPGTIAGRLWLLSPIAFSLALSFSNCGTQKSREPDRTPPKIRWTVLNRATGDVKNISGSADINAKVGENYRATCFVEDPEGVRSIKLSGSSSYTCVAPNGLVQKANFEHFPESQNLSPDSKGNVLPSIFLIRDVDADINCDTWQFRGGSDQLNCRGENYNGGIVEAGLLFHIAP